MVLVREVNLLKVVKVMRVVTSGILGIVRTVSKDVTVVTVMIEVKVL